jgi:hypothetical protein
LTTTSPDVVPKAKQSLVGSAAMLGIKNSSLVLYKCSKFPDAASQEWICSKPSKLEVRILQLLGLGGVIDIQPNEAWILVMIFLCWVETVKKHFPVMGFHTLIVVPPAKRSHKRTLGSSDFNKHKAFMGDPW